MIYLGSVVAEEIGFVGARSLCRAVDAEMAIVVEAALVGDTPLVDPKDVPVQLGGGPVLIHKDKRVVYDPEMSERVEQVARGIDARIQHAVYSMYGTDASETMREGVRTAAVGFPTRYTHSPFETVATEDLEETVRVLQAFLESEPAWP
jgi:putative aminopeptidase FrvX